MCTIPGAHSEEPACGSSKLLPAVLSRPEKSRMDLFNASLSKIHLNTKLPFWRKHHHHLPAFQFGMLFYNPVILQIGLYPYQHSGAEFLMHHFPSPEPHGDFDLVAVLQKAGKIAQFDLIIPDFSPGTEFDLFDLNLFLLLFGRLPLLGLFKQIFAVIYNPAHWWI